MSKPEYRRPDRIRKAKQLLEQLTYQVPGKQDVATSYDEKLNILSMAAEEMQKSGIKLKGPKFIEFVEGEPKVLPVAYHVLFDRIENRQIKPESISDVADSLLSLHSEFSRVNGGGRHTKKQRRRRGKKTRRSTRKW